MRIDSHLHFSARHCPEHMAPILERNRFDGAIAVQPVPSAGETRRLLRLASEHAFVLGVAGWADLGDPRLGDVLDEYQRHPKFRGICHSPGDEIPAGLAEIARRGIPLDLLLRPGQLPLVPRIAGRVPELRMAITLQPIDEWAGDFEQAAGLPQVCCKVTGSPLARQALAVFGPRRLMFGSGWPACLPARTWKATLAAFTQSTSPLPTAAREELLGGTAGRFYGIA